MQNIRTDFSVAFSAAEEGNGSSETEPPQVADEQTDCRKSSRNFAAAQLCGQSEVACHFINRNRIS